MTPKLKQEDFIMKKVMKKIGFAMAVIALCMLVVVQFVKQQEKNITINQQLEAVAKDPYTYIEKTGYVRVKSPDDVNVSFNNTTSVCQIANEATNDIYIEAECFSCGWEDFEKLGTENVTRTCKCGKLHFTIEMEFS